MLLIFDSCSKDDFSPNHHHEAAIKRLLSAPQSIPQNSFDELERCSDQLFIIGNLGPTYISYREKQCLIGIIQMKTAKKIAVDLNISHKTVENYVSKLKSRLGAKSKNDLFVIAKKNRIIT